VRFSKKSEYAIFALTEIAMRAHKGEQWSPISQIATATGIPEKFLEQILLVLKKAGFLQSRRGVEGGYSLKAKAEDLNLEQVIELLDGGVAVEPESEGRVDKRRELLFSLLRESEAAARAVLRETSIAQMAERVAALKGSRAGMEYQI